MEENEGKQEMNWRRRKIEKGKEKAGGRGREIRREIERERRRERKKEREREREIQRGTRKGGLC